MSWNLINERDVEIRYLPSWELQTVDIGFVGDNDDQGACPGMFVTLEGRYAIHFLPLGRTLRIMYDR